MHDYVIFEVVESKFLNPSWKGYSIIKKYKDDTTVLMDNLTKEEMRNVYLNGAGMQDNSYFVFVDCIEDFDNEFPACGFCFDGKRQLEKDGHCKLCNVIYNLEKWDECHL